MCAQVSGGLPANLSGPIRLCARSDDDAARHFDGRLAYLGAQDHCMSLLCMRCCPACNAWNLDDLAACQRTLMLMHAAEITLAHSTTCQKAAFCASSAV